MHKLTAAHGNRIEGDILAWDVSQLRKVALASNPHGGATSLPGVIRLTVSPYVAPCTLWHGLAR